MRWQITDNDKHDNDVNKNKLDNGTKYRRADYRNSYNSIDDKDDVYWQAEYPNGDSIVNQACSTYDNGCNQDKNNASSQTIYSRDSDDADRNNDIPCNENNDNYDNEMWPTAATNVNAISS